MKLLFTLFLSTYLFGCIGQDHTITFVNHSGSDIDSLHLGVHSADGYIVRHYDLKIGDSVVAVIPHDKPRSNRHDITISYAIYIKDRAPISQYSYNDLIGFLNYDSRIVLNSDYEIEWKRKWDRAY